MGEAAVDTAKSDGGGGSTIDRVLAKLDSIHSRMDAIEAKASRDDAKGKKDDGDLTLQHEGSEKEPPPVQGGEHPPVAADKKKKSDSAEADDSEKKADGKKRADRDKDEDTTVGNVTKGDEAKKPKAKADWDDEDEDKDKKKDDAAKPKAKVDGFGEDEQEREISKGKGDSRDDARADEFERMKARLARLESREAMSDDDVSKYADAQAKADSVMQLFGKAAPRWLAGESLANYRKRLATPLRVHSSTWKDEKLSDLPDSVFGKIEGAIYADAAIAARHPVDLGEGEFRKITNVDPDTGLKQITWAGDHSFIKDLGRPGRRVTRFLTRKELA